MAATDKEADLIHSQIDDLIVERDRLRAENARLHMEQVVKASAWALDEIDRLRAALAAAQAAADEWDAQADNAMNRIWLEWFKFYTKHSRGGGIAISAADQMAFYEIAQPILRALRPLPSPPTEEKR